MKKMDKGTFVRVLAKKANFNISDIYDVINAMIEVFEDAAIDGVEIDIYGLGKLYTQTIPPRMGSKLVSPSGEMLPEAKRIVFKLSENIRKLAK